MSFRHLPSIDLVLSDPATQVVLRQWGLRTVKQAVRTLQNELRSGSALPSWATSPGSYATHLEAWLLCEVGHGYERVFNLTGTLVHTNLGRSLLGRELAHAALQAVAEPTTLEYDLRTGQRGDRERIVRHRLRLLTGAEHATVVNNNAAAVLLVLNTLAHGRTVPVSRGELIELGGSFRLPEVMERAGCALREVGTTNRTHAADYEQAIDDSTALLLKAHPSNYRIEGFASEVSLRTLAAIAHRHDLPVCMDAGSSTLIDLTRFGLPREPMPGELLDAGADLVTFSGDKLLGSVQAGIVIGRRDLIERINANPMKRALRLDKVALALLDATLKLYEDEATAIDKIPLLKTLALPMAELDRRATLVAEALQEALRNVEGAHIAVEPARSQLGSGALPGRFIPSRAVTVAFRSTRRLREFEAALRSVRPAVIGRIANDRLWLDMRGATPLAELLETLAGAA